MLGESRDNGSTSPYSRSERDSSSGSMGRVRALITNSWRVTSYSEGLSDTARLSRRWQKSLLRVVSANVLKAMGLSLIKSRSASEWNATKSWIQDSLACIDTLAIGGCWRVEGPVADEGPDDAGKLGARGEEEGGGGTAEGTAEGVERGEEGRVWPSILAARAATSSLSSKAFRSPFLPLFFLERPFLVSGPFLAVALVLAVVELTEGLASLGDEEDVEEDEEEGVWDRVGLSTGDSGCTGAAGFVFFLFLFLFFLFLVLLIGFVD